jgi:acyl-coenzyme A thioesterase PaaI-like protein
MKELPHTHSCFVCGESNPHGLKLRFHAEGNVVTAKFRPCPEHIGFKGVVHGGITATVLDEIMVWACVVATRKFAFCAELNVRYLQPLTPDVEVLVTSELVADRRGRILEAKAAVLNAAGEPLVQATGKYMPIRTADASLMMADFIGDASWLTQLGKPV